METHLCKNCGNEYSENYCNRCGQKTVHRITLSHVGHEVVHAVTHADKGIIHLQFFQERTFKGGVTGVFAYLLGFVFYLIFLAVIGAITLLVIFILKKAG